MLEIVWKESYSVGVEEIDRQHQDFIKLIRRLQILQEKNNPKHLVVRYLRELGAYAAYHFVSEENIMFLTKYPDQKKQETEHNKLLDQFKDKVSRVEAGELPLKSMIRFLEDWFLTHTGEEDKKIGGHLQQLPGRESPSGKAYDGIL
jgi:hemerythrin